MEESFKTVAEAVALMLEMISILLIAMGGLEAVWRALWPMLRGRATQATGRVAWVGLARWLLLGLEFMLAADIVRTAISPDWQTLGQLAAIAAIRTFLNYFLERDLEAAWRLQEAK